jgi:Tol biopolymer transport system component
MSDLIGTTLGHYRIVEKIGEGGMGVVYRAHDERLDRDVAIKVLPEAVAGDPHRLARFEREAKLLASLSHQNVATLHGLEIRDGQRFLVMELAEGETLAERIKKGPLPIDDALDYARQIAEGLEAAHEQGIIHRDLKPANVMVSPGGKVKVLDFGLAKVWQLEESDADLTHSPTLTFNRTSDGVVLGTAAYMSPEQATGKPVDQRADVWAFGCVMYEMFTGRMAFGGDTITEIIASILKSDPEWKHVPSAVPRAVQGLLQACLRRDLKTRLASIVEARTTLADSSYSRWSAIANGARTGAEKSGRFWWVLVVLAVASFAYWQMSRPPVPAAGPATLKPLTANPLERSVTGAAISPDGRYLAYVDPDGLHLQLIYSGETRTMELAAGLAPWKVKWYPDGTRLLLLAKVEEQPMSLWSIAALGGRIKELQAGVFDASVSPDGTKLAFIRGASTRDQSRREIWLSGAGGEDARLVFSAGSEESFWNLAWSPDSQRLAYGTWGKTTSIMSCRLDGTNETVLLSRSMLHQDWTGPLPFVWASDGRLIFSRHEVQGQMRDQVSSSVWTIETDVSRGTAIGEPRRITQAAGSNVRGLSVSNDGKMIVAHLVRNQADIWVGRLNAEGTGFSEETRLTDDEWPDYATAWSHDSASVVFWSVRGGARHIFQIGVPGRIARPLVRVSGPAASHPMPVYSSDGRYLLYLSKAGSVSRIPAGGGPPVEILAGLPVDDIQCLVGSELPCLVGYIHGNEYVFISIDVDSGHTEELLRISHHPPFTNWELSRDGSTLAVVHNDDDTIRLISVSTGQEKTVHVQGWTSFEFVTWSADGQRLFINAGFASTGGFPDLLSVDLDGSATVLRRAPSQWHVYPVTSPDGRYLAFSSMPFHGNAWLISGFS